ncbi:hypothetical protein P43SY_007019 [Pythium insidiosum]|uniref:Methyltransferase domain-containing protein n=1 Tax=Pythium insidiosum TaxID=114742 RepID=A0AAD5M6J6_PYTIN|nr:hypothetical protein P43SY_007019 [Pythium insidiosum]
MKSWVRNATQQARSGRFAGPPLEYGVNQSRLDPALQRAFVQLDCDDETQAFLETCNGGGILEAVASTFLGMFYSLTDANGILGRGQMFVLSREQIKHLLQKEQRVGGTLLDIGAGDGNVTQSIASIVDNVRTTEVSAPMVANLNKRGFNCVETSELTHPHVTEGKPYTVISLMNVLDRADTPMTMLSQIRELLDPEQGLFLLAVVLPFHAFVEVGTKRVPPSEVLPMQGGLCVERASFEASASVLYRNVLQPAGFELVSFSRVPYLCRGDMQQAYYVLSDAIFVLRVASGQS